VTLVASAGPANVVVPNIYNAPWPDAKKALDKAGLLYAANPPSAPSETIDAGKVLRVKPAVGTSVGPDMQIDIVLSSGHAPVQVPDVTDEKFGDAVKLLVAKHFKVKRAPQDDFSAKVKKGNVISTEPPLNTPAPYGSTVIVHVSKGPDLVAVPDVTFETIKQATIDLEARGLVVGNVRNYRSQNSVVVSQSPSSGKVLRGSMVDLVLNPRSGGG
jgi:serine/threonine-protein kinase